MKVIEMMLSQRFKCKFLLQFLNLCALLVVMFENDSRRLKYLSAVTSLLSICFMLLSPKMVRFRAAVTNIRNPPLKVTAH